ncbi:MAG: CotH kinase family protein [Candidatus Eremiobacteraeota bacterium]|nr:CotH kinase family protein [Candidatus Eremiobacteraeota bacterium]
MARFFFRAGGLWERSREGRVRRVPVARLLGLAALLAVTFVASLGLQLGQSKFLVDVLGTRYRMQSVKFAAGNLWARLVSLATATTPPTDSQLPSYDIFVADNTLREMLDALRLGDPKLGREPGGDRPWFAAYVVSPEAGMQKCKIGLRGSNDWHHTPAKPSLRLKISASDQRGRRYLELQRPEDPLVLANWLPEYLAEKLDLMTPRSRPVRLSINQKYSGVYLDGYRIGEPLALANGRLPGAFFKGEDVGGTTPLWVQPDIWSRTDAADPENEFFNQALQLVASNRFDPDGIEAFATHFDREKMARWCALLVLSASLHIDDQHNQTFFYDSDRGHLEPVVWDVNGFGLSMDPDTDPDLILNLWQALAYADPTFLRRRDQILWELIEQTAGPDPIGQVIDDYLARVEPDLRADPANGGVVRFWPDAPESVPERAMNFQVFHYNTPAQLPALKARFKDFYARRCQRLREYFQAARYQVESVGGGTQVTVYGTVAVKVRSRSGRVLISGQTHGFSATWLLDSGRRFGDLEPVRRHPVAIARPAPFVYQLANPPQDLEFSNPYTGEALSPSQQPLPAGPTTVHPFFLFPSKGRQIQLGPGRVHLEQDLVVRGQDELTLSPGTELRLDPGVSIFVFGAIRAEGSPDHPIRLRAAGREPWGCLALVGQSTVTLRGLDLEGGSLDNYQGYRFKGMFDAYGVGQIHLRDCRFGPNHQSDDAANLAYSQVKVENCLFERCNADGLDLDLCRGAVRDCRFVATGNDGLDLSTNQLKVDNCSFEDCGDKGISVGEASKVEVTNCHMRGCAIGLQSKDGSFAQVVDSRIQDCAIGLSAYRKKRIFPRGGDMLVRGTTITGSRDKDVDEQALSNILIQ